MKSDKLKYLSLMMAGVSIAQTSDFYESYYHKPKELLEPRRKSTIKGMSVEQKAIENGLKRFDYPNGFVHALNKKNADKKAKKLGYID